MEPWRSKSTLNLVSHVDSGGLAVILRKSSVVLPLLKIDVVKVDRCDAVPGGQHVHNPRTKFWRCTLEEGRYQEGEE